MSHLNTTPSRESSGFKYARKPYKSQVDFTFSYFNISYYYLFIFTLIYSRSNLLKNCKTIIHKFYFPRPTLDMWTRHITIAIVRFRDLDSIQKCVRSFNLVLNVMMAFKAETRSS